MNTSKIKVAGLLSLPLLAIAVAVMVFAFNPANNTTEAAVTGSAMSLSINGQTGKVTAPENGVFTVQVNADSIPATGYSAVQAYVGFGNTGLINKKNFQVQWPDCEGGTFVTGQAVDLDGNLYENSGCLTALLPANQFESFHKGPIFSYDATCDKSGNTHTIQLLALGDNQAGTSGAAYLDGTGTQVPAEHTDDGNGNLIADEIQVNCVPATDTPTPSPTNTPPAVPRMSKCDQTDNDEDGIKDNGACSPLVNVFLTRQGAKVPSDTCLAGTDAANLAEKLSGEIDTIDPKGDPQGLAAFEFELHYDSTKVCVEITPGPGFVDAGAVCVTEDSATKPQLEGVARAGCVTVKKGHDIDELLPMANITVRPQPDVYSQAKPNQSNGVVVQLNNVGCDVSDEQGHAVPLFSCDDADITFRFLEGDVEPDCIIDAIDAQAIAFRWGATKGNLIYRDFMNLEPSGTQSDNDIDINDLQFVYGRFNSTCKEPHPDYQAIPQNPKA